MNVIDVCPYNIYTIQAGDCLPFWDLDTFLQWTPEADFFNIQKFTHCNVCGFEFLKTPSNSSLLLRNLQRFKTTTAES